MNRQEAIDNDTPYACLGCNRTYRCIPTEWYEDGHGGHDISMCPHCGSDVFTDLRVVENHGTK